MLGGFRKPLHHYTIPPLLHYSTLSVSPLASFDPDRLQEQFDRLLKRGSLLGVPAKLRYWDLFRDHREELLKDPDDAFRTLFGEEFARAYEAQLQRLKNQRRSKPEPEPDDR